MIDQWTIARTEIPAVTGVHDLYFVYQNPNMRDGNENGIMFDWLHFTEPFPTGKKDAAAKEAYATYWQLLNAKVPGIPVMQDNPADMQRETRIFERGNWLVKGAEVKPGIPASLKDLKQ